MDDAQDRHLTIAQASGHGNNEEGFMVQVALDGESVRGPLKLLDPFSQADHAHLRWYLEQYAAQEPFESDKAHAVAASIDGYAKELHHQLDLGGLFQKRDPLVDEDYSLVIDVCEGYVDGERSSVSLQALNWELLEQLDLWSGYFKRVTVRRVSSQAPANDGRVLASSTQISESVNVLVVVARSTLINPTAYQDVHPFASLDVLLAMQKTLQQAPEAPRLNVEVVRPGTFDSFKRHLRASTDSRGAGCYHFVHLDMHGSVAKRRLAGGNSVETAWLHFASPESSSKPKPVPADSVAKVLVEHGITCAILNACESARADHGLQANLAMTFLHRGVSNILAMSYKFPSSGIDPFFSSFYEALLCRGLPISAAATESRKNMKEQAVRKGRFGLELQVRDWFIPVSYLANHDVSFRNSRRASPASPARASIVRNITTKDRRIIGRDYDLLRLEEVVGESNVVLVHGAAGVGKTEFVKYAFDLWKSTQFFDKFSVVSILDCLEVAEDNSNTVTSQIAKDLEVPMSYLEGSHGLSGTDDSLPGWQNAIVLLDGIQEVFNKAFTEGLGPMVNTIASLLRKLTNSEVKKAGRKVTFILTSRLGKDWWEVRCPGPLVSPEYFELAGLELSAAITFAESVLQRNGFSPAKRSSRDLDFLVHIINLLQRIPLAIKLALPTFTGTQTSLEETFKAIHVGHINLNYGSLTARTEYSFIIVLKTVYERFNEYQDSFCGLADFWVEGPLRLHSYIHDMAAYSGISQVYKMDKMVAVLNELGAWHVSEQDQVEWLHPLFTLYLRQRRQRHAYKGAPLWAKGIMKVCNFLDSKKRANPFGSTASLQIEIPWHFVRAVGVLGETNFMTDILMSGISGLDAPKSAETMRRSLFNILSALDMICRQGSTIPMAAWPRDYIAHFLPPSQLALSPPEQEMLTGYIEALLDVFQEKIGGFAADPELQVFTFNILVHLLSQSVLDRMGRTTKTEQLVTRALAIVDASEAKYGPIRGEEVMWKAMIYRFQAVFLLLQPDEAGADAAWDKMTAIELECFGPSAFQGSTFDSSATGQPSPLDSLQGLMGGQTTGKFRKAVASWVPVRHAAWPLIKEQVLRRGDAQAAVRGLCGPGLEGAFENMVGAQHEAGWTGLERWHRYFPPRSDLDGYMRRAEDPAEFLQQLEDGLGRGDWKVAAAAHVELAKRAGAAMKLDHVLFHLTQLADILADADPQGLMGRQVKAAVGMMELGLGVMQRGAVTDADCLEIVDTMQEAGLDIEEVYRAQGFPDEFALQTVAAAERARNPVRSLEENLRQILAAAMERPGLEEENGDTTQLTCVGVTNHANEALHRAPHWQVLTAGKLTSAALLDLISITSHAQPQTRLCGQPHTPPRYPSLSAVPLHFAAASEPSSAHSPADHLATRVSTDGHHQQPPTTTSAMSSSIRRAAPLVFPAASRHTATVIFVHGLGDTGAGWADAVEHWQRRHRLDEIKFVLPNAPVIPITMNHGFQMPGWFDIKSLAPAANALEPKAQDEDAAGMLQSRAYLHSLIQDEISAGIPADRIVLGGFSQGGAMSIFAGLTAPFKIAGIVGLSSWLLLKQTFKEHVPKGDVNKATPILMGHGDRDPLVRYEMAQASEKALKEMGYDVTMKTYRGMEHSACLDELNEVEAFLHSRLPVKGN
ncbi:Uncharacterized protein TPAR_07089 [Tolypocladium paradoxum]|uniref:Acyl-protein thioesterase 1 n=1 Tax=Tolypocladium paradoxum TaxID=94208 RepID=A0A2S4KR48_9HYPO|nr:Uncharacterized protein TPAR_07089 [Tolypocladium paradoxum]